MALINESDAINLAYAVNNINRAKQEGLTNADVTSATSVATLITAIEARRDAASPAARPVFDALLDSIRWMQTYEVIDDTLANALTTVNTASANTDLRYLCTNHASFPSSFAVGSNDLSIFQPNA